MQIKSFNQLNSEKKLFLLVLTVFFLVVNTFVLYTSYRRVRTNLEQVASNIVHSMNIGGKENSRIASLLATRLNAYSHFEISSGNIHGEPINKSSKDEVMYNSVHQDDKSNALFALFDTYFKRDDLDVTRYDIKICSIKENSATMIISTSFYSLFNFKIPDIDLENGYYITASVNLRSLINTEPEFFININLLMTFVALLFLMLHNSNVDMLNRLTTDSLTQALSREGGRLVIEGLSAKKGQVLVVTDLNDFKIINDTYGHQTGDEALVYFSRYMMNSLHEKDSMIRMGGDEFMLLMRDVSVKQATEKMAQLAAGLHSFPHEQCEIPLTFSYGVSEVTSDFSDCYKKADERLYQMKKRHHARKGSKRANPVKPQIATLGG